MMCVLGTFGISSGRLGPCTSGNSTKVVLLLLPHKMRDKFPGPRDGRVGTPVPVEFQASNLILSIVASTIGPRTSFLLLSGGRFADAEDGADCVVPRLAASLCSTCPEHSEQRRQRRTSGPWPNIHSFLVALILYGTLQELILETKKG